MVTLGLTEGLDAVEVNPAGTEVHAYVFPATAVSPMVPPLVLETQVLVKSFPALTEIAELSTVTVTLSVAVHPLVVFVFMTV